MHRAQHLRRQIGGWFGDILRGFALGTRDLAAILHLRTRKLLHSSGRALDLERTSRRVLVIDDLLPDPRFGAGYPRALAMVRSLLASGFVVDLYPMASTAADCRRLAGMIEGAITFHHGAGERGLQELLFRSGAAFEAVLVSRPGPMSALRRSGWKPSSACRLIYDAEAIVTPREQRRRQLFGIPWSDRSARRALHAELALARDAAAITAVSELDAEIIRSVVDAPVFVLPHSAVARSEAPGPARRDDLLFVGRMTGKSAQSPNVDAVIWFAKAVLPKLDRLLGRRVKLHLVGLLGSPEIQSLKNDHVVIHGMVDDLRPIYDRCRLFVAPTRYAAGIPLKLLEAMCEGLPCVATTLLAQQLGVGDDTVRHADNAVDFAEHCAALLTDDGAWRQLQTAGLDFVRAASSPQRFGETLLAAVTGDTPEV